MWNSLKTLWDAIWKWMPVLGVVLLIASTLSEPDGRSARYLTAVFVLVISAIIFLPVLSRPVLGQIQRITGLGSSKPLAGEIFIDADAERVWDLFEPRPRQSSFMLGISRIEACPSADPERTRIELVMDREIIGFDKRYIGDVETIDPGRFVRLTYQKPYPEVMGMKTLGAEYEIHPTDNGTWVRYAETVEHRTALSQFLMRWVSPVDDMLKSLKAQVEGREDTTLAGRAMAAQRQGRPVDHAIATAPQLKFMTVGLPVAAIALTAAVPVLLWALLTVAT